MSAFKTSEFVANNWKWILTVLIGSGVLYAQFMEMQNKMRTVERRQQIYIERFNQQKDLIHKLELRVTVLETTESK